MALDTIKHETMPIIVGIMNESMVHFRLPVSFFMVKQVVPQGKCMIEKIITHNAVLYVHPFASRRVFNVKNDSSSKMLPLHIYPIIIMGNTISFAGNPSKNAINIMPSSPINLAKGSKKLEQCMSILAPFIFMFAINHIRNPAGAATVIALPNTKIVLSITDLMSIFPNCGFLYGGNSRMNDDGIPLRMVTDKIFETKNVANNPKIMVDVNMIDDSIKLKLDVDRFIKNMDIIAINSGKAQFISYNFLILHLDMYYPKTHFQLSYLQNAVVIFCLYFSIFRKH